MNWRGRNDRLSKAEAVVSREPWMFPERGGGERGKDVFVV